MNVRDSAPTLPLAVYGTLCRGEANHRRLRAVGGLSSLGPCRISGRLLDLGAYPGLIAGSGFVRGELFGPVGEDRLATLDVFEGFERGDPRGSLFLRKRAWLAWPRIEAWVYFYNASRPGAVRGRVIGSGDWKRRERL